jgi:hypothetical protein
MTSVVTKTMLNWIIKSCFQGEGNVATPTETTPTKWQIGHIGTTPAVSDTSLAGKVPYTYSTADACNAADWTHGGDGQQEVLNTTGQNLGTGCLNIPITYNTGTAFWYKATAGTIDLSATGEVLIVFFYVDDTTNIAAGADGVSVIITDENGTFTDYSAYQFNKADITAGEWFPLICRTLGTPDAQGVNEADLTAIKTLKIQVKATGDYTSDSLRIDDWIYATSAQHLKDAETGYPIHNSTQNTLVWLTKYTTAQANGFAIRETGLVNTDDEAFKRSNNTVVNKDSGKELRVTTLMKLQNA